MAPDPQGTLAAGSPEVGELDPVAPYDRSSLRGDFLVMIPGQTEQDYLRRRPRDRESEFIDGTIYLHPSAIDQIEPAEVYDRSSLPGDFMVMIAGQTEEEYLRTAPRYPFCEFIDGTVYMHAAVSYQHQFDVQFLLVLLAMFDSARDLGIVLSGPAKLRARAGSYLEPDIFILPPGTELLENDLMPDPPALLVVEVLSPSNRDHDLVQKSAIYREANAAEVWFVDGRDKVVIVDRRTTGGRETREAKSGPLHSTGLPGFWFDVDWLWTTPRPNLMRCLDRILAGPPER